MACLSIRTHNIPCSERFPAPDGPRCLICSREALAAVSANAERRLSRIRTIAQQASAKHAAADLFARLLAISLEADGVESESGAYL